MFFFFLVSVIILQNKENVATLYIFLSIKWTLNPSGLGLKVFFLLTFFKFHFRYIEFLCQQLPWPVQSSRGSASWDWCSQDSWCWFELCSIYLWHTGVLDLYHSFSYMLLLNLFKVLQIALFLGYPQKSWAEASWIPSEGGLHPLCKLFWCQCRALWGMPLRHFEKFTILSSIICHCARFCWAPMMRCSQMS